MKIHVSINDKRGGCRHLHFKSKYLIPLEIYLNSIAYYWFNSQLLVN